MVLIITAITNVSTYGTYATTVYIPIVLSSEDSLNNVSVGLADMLNISLIDKTITLSSNRSLAPYVDIFEFTK